MNADNTDPRLAAVWLGITTCERCPRLRSYCREVARVRKRAHRDEEYWGRPVPGFGDPRARILVLGLAPAAHGANRTGRVFTGDGVGASGDFLMAALHRAGFANLSTSQHPDDGLVLTDVYIAAAVRCAPPDNQPTRGEIDTCLDHLANEVRVLPRLQIVVALGKIAWDAWLTLAARQGVELPRPKPKFGHNARCTIDASSTARTPRTAGTRRTWDLVGCFHPSRQNTNTGKVTPAMYDQVFQGL
ncbi:MAG: uracil-DNA glycosylase [Vicinamibacterales bacterium]